MIAQIQNTNIHNFSLNGLNYKKIFIAIPVGDNHLKIICAFDSKIEILPVTKFDEITVNGNTFPNLETLFNTLTPIVFRNITKITQDFNTYAELTGTVVPSSDTICRVLVDEDKGISNSVYIWYADGVRMWLAATEDN